MSKLEKWPPNTLVTIVSSASKTCALTRYFGDKVYLVNEKGQVEGPLVLTALKRWFQKLDIYESV